MLTANELDFIYPHALHEYPYECCGIITGDDNGNNTVHKCENIQNRLHEEDPHNYPRDARTAFTIEPKKILKVIKGAEKKKEKIVGFYHSHPDHDAYFSDTDRKVALFGEDPAYPGAEYLIVSIFKGKIKEAISYRWNEKKEKFVKEESYSVL